MRTGIIIALLIAVVAVGGWLASDRHYDSCVSAAKARTPVPNSVTVASGNDSVTGGPSVEELLGTGAYANDNSAVYEKARKARIRAVSGCSHLPF